MIAIPFIYFSLLAYYHYRKARRVNLAVYIIAIYAISGFFSILLDLFKLRSYDTAHYQLSLLPTVIYCLSITMIVFPVASFAKYYSNRIQPLASDKSLRAIAIFGFIYFLFYLYMSSGSLSSSLTSDIVELRNDLYAGKAEVGWMGKLPSVVRLPIALINHIVGSPWVFQLLAFFALFVQKMPRKYGYMLLSISLIGPIGAMIGLDRSNVTYWIIGLVGCYLLFKPHISAKLKKRAIFYGLILLCVFIFYLWVVTSSRFSMSSSYDNSQSSIIDYLGKPFINFCFFYDNFESPFPYFGVLFPFISNTLMGEYASTVDWQDRVSLMTNVRASTFYTFLGAIMIALGKVVMYAYLFIVTIGGYIMVKPRRKQYIRLSDLYAYFLLASIPMLGLFGHFYSAGTKTFSVIFFLIILTILSKRNHR